MPTSSLILIWVGVIAAAMALDAGLIFLLRWRRARPPAAERGSRAQFSAAPAEAAWPAASWAEPAQATWVAQAWSAVRPALPLLGTLALAAVPVALVVRERWLGDRALWAWGRVWWCQLPTLCSSLFPPYLVLGLAAALAAVAILVFAQTPLLTSFRLGLRRATLSAAAAVPRGQRWVGLGLVALAGLGFVVSAVAAVAQQRLPGWDWAALLLLYLAGWAVADLPAARVAAGLRRHGGWLLAFGLAQAALVAFLVRGYADRQFPWLVAGLLAAAALNLLRYARRLPPSLWLMTLALVLFGLNLNAWWSSGIGDEYAFYFDARRIASPEGTPFIGARLFDRDGVYGTHPYFSSVIQAAAVALFGPTGAAWRISSIYLAAAAVPLVYAFARLYASRRFALTAALLLAVSHYLMAFSKIGYNNLQALFALGLVLACTAWGVRTRLPVAYAATGLSLGLCFYVYPAALYALPAALLVLLAEAFPRTRADWGRWAVLGGAGLALVFPLLLQPDYWLLKQQGTFLYNPALAGSPLVLAEHLVSNFIYALGSFLYIPQEGHLIASSFVDPLTGLLALLGLGLLLRLAPTERVARLWLLIALVELVLVGATHDRVAPPTTRMFMLLPWVALLAAVGLRWLWQARGALGLARLSAATLAVPLVAVLVGVNLYQGYPLSRDRGLVVQSMEALVVRLAQVAQRQAPATPPTFIFITDPSWGIDGLRLIPEVYPVDARFELVTITEPQLPEAALAMLADENAVIIIKPWLELSWQTALAPQLAALGKTACGVAATDGQPRFRLWHTARWVSLCAPPPPSSWWWWWRGL